MDDDTSYCCKAMDDARAEIASLRAELAKMTAECERRFDGRANLLEVQLRLANELSERYSGAAHQDAEEKARLRAPYRNADEEDWRRLDDWIGHGGHGQFWRAVFKEVRSALACTPAGVPNGVQQTEEIARLTAENVRLKAEMAIYDTSVAWHQTKYWEHTKEIARLKEKLKWFEVRLRDAVNTCYGGITHDAIDAALACRPQEKDNG